jgi:L-ascorbate metabolism protein UlaG (beta-lactamase superfamily)
MRVTYIKHSGFLVQWEDVLCLFDWAEGDLPDLPEEQRLYVFVSHVHADHFDREIFSRFRERRNTVFILSPDIPRDAQAEKGCAVTRIGADMHRVFSGGSRGAFSVTTLPSTDCGVAFVVNYAGKTVYHAGDLHWWAWPDDTPAEEKAMKKAFLDQISKLRGLEVDAAFLPLDPRLEDNYWKGFDALMRTAHVKTAFPMHMWDRYDTVEKLLQAEMSAPYRDRVAGIDKPGQVFELT